MARYPLKNIIILILALLNVFLLISLGIRGTEERNARRIQRQELVSLFAADGMTLDPGLIPEDTELSVYTLPREEALEKNAASFWLGSVSERTAQGGGIYTYSGSRGAAIFRDTGSFDIAGTLSSGDAEDMCRNFCREFSYGEPSFTYDERGIGTGTALRRWNGAPVFNGAITFTISSGAVTSVSGALLPDAGTESAADQPLLSAFAALTAFPTSFRALPARRWSWCHPGISSRIRHHFMLTASPALSAAPEGAGRKLFPRQGTI